SARRSWRPSAASPSRSPRHIATCAGASRSCPRAALPSRCRPRDFSRARAFDSSREIDVASRITDEMQQLLALRDELARRAAGTPAGRVHEALGFEIGEIDLRLKELWSGEESGVKQVVMSPATAPLSADDRRSQRAGA